MYSYTGYGVAIHSAIELPFPPSLMQEDLASLTIEFGESELAVSSMETVNLGIKANAMSMALIVPFIATYVITRDRIVIEPVANCDLKSIQAVLLSSALGYWLTLVGKIVLRGTAITDDGETAKVFLGGSVSGVKLMKQGVEFLSDSFVVISEYEKKFLVEPGFPVVKVWKKEAKVAGLDVDGMVPIREGVNRFYWDVSERFCKRALPISGLYTETDRRLKNEPLIKKITGLNKLKWILPFQASMPLHTVWKSHIVKGDSWFRLAKQVACFSVENIETMPVFNGSLFR